MRRATWPFPVPARRSSVDTASGVMFGILIVLVVILAAVGLAAHLNPQPGEPRTLDCSAEDEVLVMVYEDAHDLIEGELHCVHVEVLRGHNPDPLRGAVGGRVGCAEVDVPRLRCP